MVTDPRSSSWFGVNLNLHGAGVPDAAINGFKTKSFGGQVNVEVVDCGNIGRVEGPLCFVLVCYYLERRYLSGSFYVPGPESQGDDIEVLNQFNLNPRSVAGSFGRTLG